MDALSDILSHVKFRGSLYFTTEFSSPWGVHVPAFSNVARFHLVMRGNCFARVGDREEPVELSPGDFIVIPHGAAHELLDCADGKVIVLDRVLEDSGYDGKGHLAYGLKDEGEETRLICGHFAFDSTSHHPMLSELPDTIVVRSKCDTTQSWLEASFKLLEAEYAATRPGNEAIINRMTEILFVQAIRDWLEHREVDAGVLKALGDQRVGRALAAVHREPGERWTVETMAREAGLSRTVFAKRFQELANTTPMNYVTSWRLEKARSLLVSSDHSIEEIAAQVGYRSVAAFSRIFTRHMGIGPGALRRSRSEAA